MQNLRTCENEFIDIEQPILQAAGAPADDDDVHCT